MDHQSAEARWQRLTALLGPLYEQAATTARRLCRSRADGDDLFQETLVRAFSKLHTLRDPSRFRGWFYATLLSVHRTRGRRSFWRRFLPIEEVFRDGAEPAGVDGRRWEDEARRAERAAHALAGLPAVQREAVVLFEIEGFAIEEIAELQRVTASAVKSRLARGRQRLRRHYERLALARPEVTSGGERGLGVTGSAGRSPRWLLEARGQQAPPGSQAFNGIAADPVAGPARGKESSHV